VESKRKIWTLEDARKIFPQIYKITEKYYHQVEALRARMEAIIPENEQETLEDEVSKLIQLWAFSMFEFGVEVKGLWLIDFDNGKGYYCWKYNEPDILYEHDYFSGYQGRKLIQE
jgi:hypothetical protein